MSIYLLFVIGTMLKKLKVLVLYYIVLTTKFNSCLGNNGACTVVSIVPELSLIPYVTYSVSDDTTLFLSWDHILSLTGQGPIIRAPMSSSKM